MTRVELVRSGGFAGLSLRAAVDTMSGDEPDARWIDAALEGVDVAALASRSGSAGGAGPGGPGAPDRFVYQLAVDRDGERHELTFGEQAVPEPLRPVVERLVERARRGPSDPAGPSDPGVPPPG